MADENHTRKFEMLFLDAWLEVKSLTHTGAKFEICVSEVIYHALLYRLVGIR
jgi:hypothetical protein